MKKGPLSNAEKEEVSALFLDDKSVDEICKITDRSTNVVEKYIATLESQKAEPEQQEVITSHTNELVEAQTQTIKGTSSIGMINKTVGKQPGISVMTQQASETTDEKRKRGDENIKIVPIGAQAEFEKIWEDNNVPYKLIEVNEKTQLARYAIKLYDNKKVRSDVARLF